MHWYSFNYYLIFCINNSYLYLSECPNKKKYKSNFQDLSLKHSKLGSQKSLVILKNLSEKFVLRTYQLGYMVLQPSSHADGTKHKESLPKDTPILFFNRTEPSSSASILLSNDAGDSKANNNKQFLWEHKMWVHCEVWNCTLLCWIFEFPVERCRIFCCIIWWILKLLQNKKQKKPKKNKSTFIFDFGILAKMLWIQVTIVQNSLVSHLQMIYAPISNSVLVHYRKKNFFKFLEMGQTWIYFFSKLLQKSIRMKNLAN